MDKPERPGDDQPPHHIGCRTDAEAIRPAAPRSRKTQEASTRRSSMILDCPNEQNPARKPPRSLPTSTCRHRSPAVTASRIRIGSTFADSCENIGAWTISMVKMPNVALLRRPEWVRSPAGRFLHSLSNPIAAPKTEANKSLAAITTKGTLVGCQILRGAVPSVLPIT